MDNDIRYYDDNIIREKCNQGVFWIIAENVKDIHRGKFKIVGEKFRWFPNNIMLVHKHVWIKNNFDKEYNNVSCYHYPRGEVRISQDIVGPSIAYIRLHSTCNVPKVIDAVVKEYGLKGLVHEIELPDVDSFPYGSHYKFELQ